ncbi:hypothetical protein SAMN05443575_0719 [Jatrophihabitans endophyticus]|uniref:Uncharacterized protein n=1 Tax=Jatrophihabitans endophyticus TaxID=1206085 RepID=A0A1M5DX94_9ACTN|nr:DUF6221 family protein [Jatrophihabitans endophyticus]SHF71540.1 hypothetical protein SAMN05443575_0719 [Jatrophihabitans endophyticus]
MSLTLPVSATSELVRFLLDRLDEDDDELRHLARDETRGAAPKERERGLRSADRLRAEIIAKRHVIGDLQQLLILRDLPSEKTVRDAATQALRALAAPYAEHRQYRTEWRAPKRR